MRNARVNRRPFWSLVGASALSNLGDGIRLTAFPALAAILTRDPVALAGVAVAMRLPWLIFGLHAGVIVDRYDRRQLMVAMGTMRTAVLCLLSVAVLVDWISVGLLYAVALVVGVAEVVFDTSAQAMVPSLVDRQDLETANGRVVVAEIVGNEFAGPGLGGALFGIAVAVPFIVNAGLAAGAVVFLLAIQGSFVPSGGKAAERRTMAADIVIGLRWLWRHRVLRAVTVLAGAMSFVDSAAYAILILYAIEVLGLSTFGYGILVMMSGVGGIVGSLLSGRITRGGSVRVVMLTAITALGISQLGIAITSSPVVAGLLWATAGCGYGLWGVVSMSLRQRLVPDHMLGRVGSAHRLVALGAAPIGALAGGVIAASYTLRAPFVFGAAMMAVALLVAIRVLTAGRIAEAVTRADAAAEVEGPGGGGAAT